MTKQEIGSILMQLREKSGKSREEVADLLGKSVKTVGHWETGYAQPDANTLFLLCTIYDADLNTSFGFPAAKKELPTVSDEEHLDQEIISRLVQLTPEELEKVDAFVQGLLAAR